jgi:hypothetical protein
MHSSGGMSATCSSNISVKMWCGTHDDPCLLTKFDVKVPSYGTGEDEERRSAQHLGTCQ